ncbi:putative glycolate oxidase [Fulvimarina pelagi HTCC2506]|uniref:D-2-hydroxyglutarate dehydrogenase n=1 Tax=Fulvimarina pelagi HTCC2506 TaxID=314231 RepID=Q0FXK9_9HYPH|nr:FAD-binding and (Fe-S)-binding domain-containing protein [Fulvimarina pelagi]EAU39727.1 putative glycolate oxidase [Fulvimarina pelagi HTCC2506]
METLRPGLERRLRNETAGEVFFDRFSRGRYATDASIYQMMPAGVVLARTADDVAASLDAVREAGIALTMRGGGTSQCGQTVNSGLIVDTSKYMNKILELDIEGQRALVEPGIVLDDLNRLLKPHGLWFPVDVSTASRATIGGMAGNNSCGSRSLRYGTMRDNVIAIDAILADGTRGRFARLDQEASGEPPRDLIASMLALGRREAEEIAQRFPKVQRRVGGYNLDALVQGDGPVNLAHLLVGSEGTLGISTAIEINLSPLPKANKRLGVCHFPTFRAAMEAAQHIVALKPTSVELVDSTMLALAGDIPMFRSTLDAFVQGRPAALLLTEFADDPDENAASISRLEDVMSDLGYGFGRGGEHEGGVVTVSDAKLQSAIAELRAAGLNIMMSMKEAGKPVSFVEDCAVPLEHLADYTDRLTAIFEAHGTRGTWYAHASEGCLHVRPVLNVKLEKDVKAMRAIAEEAFAMVREYKGSHSGEHGDGIVRSEFHEAMFGPRITGAFEDVKTAFDPSGLLNPGKIVNPPKMDDRSLMRYPPGYAVKEFQTAFDWSAWTGSAGGFQGAVEMCNNNGACRKSAGAVMCPSYRVTRNERDVTRGRANTLRLAISGQLGPDAIHSDEMAETLKLCVSCKACRRECPTGVDMAKMKAEVLYQRGKREGFSRKDRLIADMPRMAPYAARMGGLLSLRDKISPLAKLSEKLLGFSSRRTLPVFRRDFFRDQEGDVGGLSVPRRSVDRSPSRTNGAALPAGDANAGVPLNPEGAGADTATGSPADAPSARGLEHTDAVGLTRNRADAASSKPGVVLFADTFGRYFDPQTLRAAVKVLSAAGYSVETARPSSGKQPLCCGRTYIASGMADRARQEAERTIAALIPHVRAGRMIVGLEPSCLLTLRDEFPALVPGKEADELAAGALLLEEFLARESSAGRLTLPLKALGQKAFLHGHCHQKAFGAMPAVETALRLIPDLDLTVIESSCCGMAGAFGYDAETIDVSLAMGELSLLPAVRKAPDGALIIADGTSCRHQIHDGAQREAIHVAEVLAMALD